MKSLSDNNRILKNNSTSYDIKPFLLRSVSSLENASGYEPNEKEGESQKNKLAREAFEKGFAEGIASGRMHVLEELRSERSIVRSLIDSVQKISNGIYGMIEADIVELSISMARKIVYEAAEKDRDVVVNTVREVIRKTSDRETIKIKISPVDYDVLNKNKSELLQFVDGIKSLSFDVDETIHPGGCMVETKHGDIDARIDSQFRIIEEEIRRTVNKEHISEEEC